MRKIFAYSHLKIGRTKSEKKGQCEARSDGPPVWDFQEAIAMHLCGSLFFVRRESFVI